MIDRALALSGHLSTALMLYGLGALAWSPHAYWSTVPVYAGLLILMLTPVTRVVIACAGYVRAHRRDSGGDRAQRMDRVPTIGRSRLHCSNISTQRARSAGGSSGNVDTTCAYSSRVTP
jgi:hypothetical protein